MRAVRARGRAGLLYDVNVAPSGINWLPTESQVVEVAAEAGHPLGYMAVFALSESPRDGICFASWIQYFATRGRVEEQAEVLFCRLAQKYGDSDSVDLRNWETTLHAIGCNLECREL